VRRRGSSRRSGSLVGVAALLAAAAALTAASATLALAGREAAPPAAAAQAKLEKGKRLYRKYCGQCHALREARAVGFGTDGVLGKNGGPSFDNLRVPFNLSVLLVTQRSSGHENLPRKLTWAQVRDVAAFVAKVTRDHPMPALPIDG
jgi:mono/diheme cytochrome c family protein